VGEVSVLLLEGRAVSERPFDVVGQVWPVARIEVGLHGLQKFLRWLGDRAKNRLATDDDEFVLPDDIRGGSDHMLEVEAADLLT
jgi:hypothetical protein